MKQNSLIHLIYSHLRSQPNVKINGGAIEHFAQQEGYKAETGGRRARDLAKLGRELQRSGKKGGYVLSQVLPGDKVASIWFWYVPSEYENFHQKMQEEPVSLFS